MQRLSLQLLFVYGLSGCQGSSSHTSVRSPASTPAAPASPSAVVNSTTQASSVASQAQTAAKTSSGSTMLGANEIALYTNGPASGTSTRRNDVLTNVTICVHGTTQCQTITNILVDSQSSGLRIFRSLVTLPIAPMVTSGTNSVAECQSYGDGTADWGPLASVDLKLGSEPVAQVSVQLIDAGFSVPPPQCSRAQSTPDTTPGQAGFNGIMGVSVTATDCGSFCETVPDNEVYYSCSQTACASVTWPQATQNGNPIRLLTTDNNGLAITLQTVPAAGVATATGKITLGIGTRSNNQPTAAQKFTLDGNGHMLASVDGSTYMQAYIDSGTNFSVLPPLPGIPTCTIGPTTYDCPAQTTTFPIVLASAVGSGTLASSIVVANPADLYNANVFASPGFNLQTTLAEAIFGVSYMFGKTIYFQLESTTSPLGIGPLVAY